MRRMIAALCGSMLLLVACLSHGQEQAAFPTAGLLPKEETGASRFLSKHPTFDGRGAVVAIFDTGVDPGAEGLQTTSHGQPKIVDLVDATGSGDVDVSKVIKVVDGTLAGLSGRKLKPPAGANPTGDYHVGVKRAWDIFPGELEGRIRKTRQQQWQTAHRKAQADARQALDTFDAAHPRPTPAEKLTRSDLEARVDVLKTLADSYDDPGPLFDCVVYHDGSVWRAVIDCDEDSDLAEEQALTDFRTERGWSTFGQEDRLNFAVNIYNQGNLLSIVTDSGSHGTHVAGIVAANYPQQPELNGVAPGAQIVGVKIGDTRLDSMETGTALLRAQDVVLRNKCDLINMSYGEATTRPNAGIISEAFANLVTKHGVIFVSSAGNSGPALSTVGAPGGTTSAILGVGAYLSPAMMAAQYSPRAKEATQAEEGLAYSWTSRGPTRDGDMGVDIFAPGGAFAPVPQWTLRRQLQMNGTSMASPHACGNLALLVSAAKETKTPFSPASVRRAIQNTAQFINRSEVFAQGPGLLQVDKAWDHLQRHANDRGELAVFQATIPFRDNARGVYLREPFETNTPQDMLVRVQTTLPIDPSHQNELQFDLSVRLQSTADWVQAAESIQLSSGFRMFELRVDPTELPPGVHSAEVLGFDAARPERGPLFRLPVTVLRPMSLENEPRPRLEETLSFTPGQLERRFFAVPAGATWATLTLTQPEGTNPARFLIDAATAQPGKAFSKHTWHPRVVAGVPYEESFAVAGEQLLELCFVQEWNGIESGLTYKIEFHSLLPNSTAADLAPEGPATEVEVTAALGAESLGDDDVKAVLTTHRQIVRPESTTIRLLSDDRDRLPEGQIWHELLLTYRFDQSQRGSVTPRFPQIDGLLYDSDYGTLFWMLFDAGKRRVATNDMFPDAVTLSPGGHTLKLQIRHTSPEALQKLQTLRLALDRGIGPIDLPVSPARPASVNAGRFSQKSWLPRQTRALFITPPASYPGAAGEELLGSLQLHAHSPEIPLRVMVPVPNAPRGSASPASSTAAPDTATRLAKAQTEFQLQQLQSLTLPTDKEVFDKLAAEILAQAPQTLLVDLTRLLRLDDDENLRDDRLPEVIAAADAVLAKIDAAKLALALATNVNPEDPAAAADREKATVLKSQLVDTLYRKGRAVGFRELPEVLAKHPLTDAEKTANAVLFEATFAELRKWVDTTEPAYFLLHLRRERRQGRPGVALQLLLQQSSNAAPSYLHAEKRRDLAEELGWSHQFEYERRWLPIMFPAKMEGY